VWVQSKNSGYYLALLSDPDGTSPAIRVDNPGAVSERVCISIYMYI
jgi:hypothetical protein